GLPPGPRAAMVALIGVVVACAIPYAVIAAVGEPYPDDVVMGVVSKMQIWVPGDDIPFADKFGLEETDENLLAAQALSEAGDGEEPVAVLLKPTPETKPAPVADTDATTGGTDADVVIRPVGDTRPTATTPPPKPVDPVDQIRIPATLYAGAKTDIEDPHGAMAHFYEALAQTTLETPGAITRVTHWGDSAIAADGMPSMARRLLQQQFGDAGHGFSLVAAGNRWYLRKDIEFESRGWKVQEFIRKDSADGFYGYGGVAAVGYLGSRASWKTVDDGPVGKAASRFEVLFRRAKGGGDLEVTVDGGAETKVFSTATDEGDAPQDTSVVVKVSDGPHSFRVKNIGGGMTKLYGAVIERDIPGVVYDSIGTIGARAGRQRNIDDDHFIAQLRHRKPDLMVLMYGGNALKDKTTMAQYAASYSTVVERYRRALPQASCLVMSPIDHGEYYRRKVRTVPRQVEIMRVQREVALEQGCAWFSLYDAMGGQGSIGRWFKSSPRLAEADLGHPTAKGSITLGRLFYKSLMKGFAGHLDRRRAAAEATP
ncbi:MAG: lysophospholipase L1-like esterase, partial [Myxococcota bacterium]